MSINVKKSFLFLFFLAFLSYVVYRSQFGAIIFGDINFYLQKKTDLIKDFHLWQNFNFGSPLAFPPTLYSLFFKALSNLFPLNFISNLYYYGSYFFLSLSIFYLINKINNKAQFLDYFILCIYTITCPLIYRIITIGGIEEIYSLSFTAFAIGYLFNFRGRSNILLKEMLIFFFILLMGNVYLQTMILFYTIITIYLILFNIKYIIKNAYKLFKILGLWLSFNLFWLILPLYNLVRGNNLYSFINYDPKTEGLSMVYQISQTNKLFYPFVFENNLPVIKSLYWGNYYILILQLFFFCFAIFFNFVLNTNRENNFIKKIKLFLLTLIIVFYIFSIGMKGRGQDIFSFFWHYIPVFSSFRSIFKFLFPIYFSLLILIIYGLKKIEKAFILKYLILLLVTPALLVFFNQSAIQKTRGYQIPDYYQKVERFTNELNGKSGYTKIVPDQSWYSTFKWNKTTTDSVNILPYYISNGVLYNFATQISKDNKSKLNDIINEILLTCSPNQLGDLNNGKIFSAYGIKTILVQKDVEVRNPIINYFCLDKAKKLPYLKLIKTIGEIDIYSNINKDILPHVYLVRKVIITDDDPSMFPYFAASEKFATKSAYIFKSQNKKISLNEISNVSDNKHNEQIIKFEEINPTKFKIRLSNVKNQLLLGLNKSFHWGWYMYVNEINSQSRIFQTLFSQKYDIPEEKHLLINGYSNAWSLDVTKICLNSKNLCQNNSNNTYNIELYVEFFPQKIFVIGLLITITVIGGTIIFAVIQRNYL